MKVLITGGNGFLGRRLLNALLARGVLPDADGCEQPIERIRLNDVHDGASLGSTDTRVACTISDVSQPGVATQLLGDDTDVIFHLAAVVSGQAEQDFDLGMRINLDGTRQLLDASRAMGSKPRLLFASSVAAYGGVLPEVVTDFTCNTPGTSYGTQKVICELLINDYSRKGFIDGRVLRLPTIVVRPGKPNAAASSFASAIIREPLQGNEYVCPVGPNTAMWLLSPRKVIDAFIHAASLPESAFDGYRALAIPGMTLRVSEMVHALTTVAGEGVASRVRFEPEPFVERIIHSWPHRFETRRGHAMGFKADANMSEVIRAFIDDELGGRFVP